MKDYWIIGLLGIHLLVSFISPESYDHDGSGRRRISQRVSQFGSLASRSWDKDSRMSSLFGRYRNQEKNEGWRVEGRKGSPVEDALLIQLLDWSLILWENSRSCKEQASELFYPSKGYRWEVSKGGEKTWNGQIISFLNFFKLFLGIKKMWSSSVIKL